MKGVAMTTNGVAPGGAARWDIAEHKWMEEELEHLSSIISVSPDGFAISDMEGRIIYANEASSRIYSADDPKELLGKSWLELIAPEDRAKALAGMKQAMEKGCDRNKEYHIVTRSGSKILTEMSTALMKNRSGKPIGFAGVFRDITERKRMEQEIRDKNKQLDMQNEELRAANEELRAANEELRETQERLIRSEKLAAIGQLAGGVGHELRNPLGVIKNAVYYLKGKVSNSELAQKEPRVMEFLNIIAGEVNSCNKTINDLLGFARVRKPSVSLTQIKRVIDDALSHMLIPENVKLTKRLDVNLPKVEIDPDQVHHVLVNLVTNAVQAMPEGGKLTISATEKDGFLEVEITDTGCGIPEESAGKIFDPLFTTKAKGIGLGLAVCKAIIDAHEGSIEVESRAGKGTSFKIQLPLNNRGARTGGE